MKEYHASNDGTVEIDLDKNRLVKVLLVAVSQLDDRLTKTTSTQAKNLKTHWHVNYLKSEPLNLSLPQTATPASLKTKEIKVSTTAISTLFCA